MVVSGEIDQLGNWALNKAKPLDYVGNGEWQILLNAKSLPNEFYYKFVIVDEDTRQSIHWEDGGNRILSTQKAKNQNSVWVEMGLQFHYNYFLFKGTGTAIPVFSLRSESSFGIGDFLDLKKIPVLNHEFVWDFVTLRFPYSLFSSLPISPSLCFFFLARALLPALLFFTTAPPPFSLSFKFLDFILPPFDVLPFYPN